MVLMMNCDLDDHDDKDTNDDEFGWQCIGVNVERVEQTEVNHPS